MNRPTCRTCPYLYSNDDRGLISEEGDTDLGECQRHPPKIATGRHVDRHMVEEFRGIWPTVHEGDSCGEHPSFPAYLIAIGKAR